jgi:hypothetical protein
MICSFISVDFSYFPLKINPKVAEHGQNRSKMDLLKGGVDDCSYFSVILFSNQNLPCTEKGEGGVHVCNLQLLDFSVTSHLVCYK